MNYKKRFLYVLETTGLIVGMTALGVMTTILIKCVLPNIIGGPDPPLSIDDKTLLVVSFVLLIIVWVGAFVIPFEQPKKLECTFTLIDDESTREKYTMMTKWDVVTDDSRNTIFYNEDIEEILEWGKSYRMTVEEI